MTLYILSTTFKRKGRVMRKLVTFQLFFVVSLIVVAAAFAVSDEGPSNSEIEHVATMGTNASESKGLNFYEDFSDGDMNGWLDGGGGFTSFVTDTTAADGTLYSLEQTGGNTSHYDGVYHTFSAITPGYISYWINSGSTSTSDTYFVIGDSNITSNNGIIFFWARYTGYLVVNDGSTTHSLTPYNANQWYHVEFLLDWGTTSFDCYVDGALVASNIQFRSSSTTSLTTLHLYHWEYASGHWDQIFLADDQSGTASISDRVWYDTNLNGGQEAGEPGLPNITVNLYTAAGSLVGTQVTDANGLYLFNNLTPSSYQVEFILPTSSTYYFTTQNAGTYDADSDPNATTGLTPIIVLSEGEQDVNIDCGMWSDPLYVELISFTAEMGNRAVLLEWETAVEIDVLGFNILKQELTPGTSPQLIEVINDGLIQSQGSSLSGAHYSLNDTNIKRGKTYKYWLQSVEIDGESSSLADAQISIPARVQN